MSAAAAAATLAANLFFIDYLDKRRCGVYCFDEQGGYRRIMGHGPKMIYKDQSSNTYRTFQDGHSEEIEVSITRVPKWYIQRERRKTI